MDEKKDKYRGDVGIKVQGSFWEKLDNFWYHYKWHSIAAVFLVFVILVCSIQSCNVTKYDTYILYAGNHAYSRSTEDGSFSEYQNALSSLAEFSQDYDGNGSVNVSYLDLYLLSAEEIAEFEDDPDYSELPYQLLQENSQLLKNNLDMSDYYICFLSKRLFEQYSEGDNNEGRFARIEKYTAEGKSYEYASEYGIYLSSLGIKSLPGMENIPAEDTVICIRNVSAMSSMFDKDGSEESFHRAEEMLREILAYGN